MTKKDFLERYKIMISETMLYANCCDISEQLGHACKEHFIDTFRENPDCDYALKIQGLYWLDTDLEGSYLPTKLADSQRVIAFELWKHYVLDTKAYKELKK